MCMHVICRVGDNLAVTFVQGFLRAALTGVLIVHYRQSCADLPAMVEYGSRCVAPCGRMGAAALLLRSANSA